MQEASRTVADIFFQIQAVHCNLEQPFTFTSGTVSPMYVDCRKLISFPRERQEVTRLFTRIVEHDIKRENVQVVAGGETAGIPFAAFLADSLDLPMIYVRKQAKSFGRLREIEGQMEEGTKVLLVEDLNFDAKSKLSFCEGIEGNGGIVKHVLVIFDYGIPQAQANLESHGLSLHALTNGRDVVELATQRGYFDQQQLKAIKAFLSNPAGWHLVR